jgi:hypothetical protein
MIRITKRAMDEMNLTSYNLDRFCGIGTLEAEACWVIKS